MVRTMDLETFAYLGLGVSTFALISWRSQKSETTFGSAEWLQPWVASRKGMFRKGGLVLGDWTGLSPVYYRGTGHALTVAPNRNRAGRRLRCRRRAVRSCHRRLLYQRRVQGRIPRADEGGPSGPLRRCGPGDKAQRGA